MNELALFAGAGGGILGGKILGWRTVCAVEWEPYAASVLVARQNEGFLESFPIWDDVQTFDGRPWRGIVDVISGGFPCQDISAAGKGAGIDGKRSGMWGEMARIIHEVQPRFVFVENSPMLTSRGLGRVLGDLASMGFDAQWGVLGAADVGANHQRDRIWIVAYSNKHSNITAQRRSNEKTNCMEGINWAINGSARQSSRTSNGIGRCSMRGHVETDNVAYPSSKNVEGQRKITFRTKQKFGNISNASWWQSEPNVGRVADGVAARVDRLKAIGNGQVPLCAATAWRILSEQL